MLNLKGPPHVLLTWFWGPAKIPVSLNVRDIFTRTHYKYLKSKSKITDSYPLLNRGWGRLKTNEKAVALSSPFLCLVRREWRGSCEHPLKEIFESWWSMELTPCMPHRNIPAHTMSSLARAMALFQRNRVACESWCASYWLLPVLSATCTGGRNENKKNIE